jgi:hypothetical protein
MHAQNPQGTQREYYIALSVTPPKQKTDQCTRRKQRTHSKSSSAITTTADGCLQMLQNPMICRASWHLKLLLLLLSFLILGLDIMKELELPDGQWLRNRSGCDSRAFSWFSSELRGCKSPHSPTISTTTEQQTINPTTKRIIWLICPHRGKRCQGWSDHLCEWKQRWSYIHCGGKKDPGGDE